MVNLKYAPGSKYYKYYMCSITFFNYFLVENKVYGLNSMKPFGVQFLNQSVNLKIAHFTKTQ